MKSDKSFIILITLGVSILLLAVLGLLLAQNPDSPLPWEEPTPTPSITPPPATNTDLPTATSTGTRRPTRTPLIEITAALTTETSIAYPLPVASASPSPTIVTQVSATPTVGTTVSLTASPSPATSPTTTPTTHTGPVMITGRVVDRGNPIANILLSLEGRSILTSRTDSQGKYEFEVDWIDENYSVVFFLEDNDQLTSASDYVLWSWIEGLLEDDIELPDLEISASPEIEPFEQTAPADGASFSASQISPSTPLIFEWTAYPLAEQYWVDLGLDGNEASAWASSAVEERSVDFDGTLFNGIKISPGTYWWAVGTMRMEDDFHVMTYSQTWTLIITP